ncbi:MAG: hypothetical protein ACP5MV_00185 [Candidatus Parvarchaeum sp.]
MKGQESLEMIIIYSLAIAVIGSIFYIIFTFFPSLTGATTQPSYSGFPGFRIIQQGYISSKSLFYIKFQNLLNENVKIDGLSILISGVNYTNFVCSKTYLPALEYSECNLTSVSLGSSFSGNGYIYYTPTNISSSPIIVSMGNIIN